MRRYLLCWTILRFLISLAREMRKSPNQRPALPVQQPRTRNEDPNFDNYSIRHRPQKWPGIQHGVLSLLSHGLSTGRLIE